MGNNNIKSNNDYRVMVIDIKCVAYKISKYMDCNCLGSDYNSIDQLLKLFLEKVPLGVNYEIHMNEEVINGLSVFYLRMENTHGLVCNIKYNYDINKHIHIKNLTNECDMCLTKEQYMMYYNILEKMPEKAKEIIVDKHELERLYYSYLSLY
jgi:hypothetical protein